MRIGRFREVSIFPVGLSLGTAYEPLITTTGATEDYRVNSLSLRLRLGIQALLPTPERKASACYANAQIHSRLESEPRVH